MKLKPVPEEGKIYKFYDDGKVGSSRRYWAKVKKVLDIKDTNNILVSIYDSEEEDKWIKVTLYHIIQEEIRHCEWLYAKEQKEVICCYIPAYDCNDIWVIRDKTGGWFSIDVQSCWQGGQLDVDNSWYPENPDEVMTYWDKIWEDDLKHPYEPIEGQPAERFFEDEGQLDKGRS